jgi:hypothetical protein
MSALEVISSAVPLQEISKPQPGGEAYLDESVEFGDVSAETREMVEADFFASLRGGVS